MISGTNNSTLDNKTQNLIFDSINNILKANSTVTPDINQISSLLPSIAASSNTSQVLSLVNSVINLMDIKANDASNVFSTLSTVIKSNPSNNSQISSDKIKQSFNLVDKLIDAVAQNQVPGESQQINTPSFKILVSNLDLNNINDFVINDNTFTGKNVIRMMSTNNLMERNLDNGGCLPSSRVCILKNSLINSIQNSSSVSCSVKILPSSNLPIEYTSTSSNAVSVKLFANSNSNSRTSLLKFNYTARLDLSVNPGSFNDSNVMSQTYCTTFDSNYENQTIDSCSSWYDYNFKKIQCECNTGGVTVNIINADAAKLSIQRQFPIITTPLITLTFLYIFGISVGIFFLFLIFAICQDSYDDKNVSTDENYDIVQQCIIEYTKEEFHEEYNFTNLYCYLVKVTYFLF